MIYGFAKQSGGHAKIYSEVGDGTTVRLYIPRHPTETAAAEAELEHPRGGETILVVEDDALVRSFVVLQLRDLGYSGSRRPTGRRRATCSRATRPSICCSRTWRCPRRDGPQLADGARRRRPKLKVLLTSGYTENPIVHKASSIRACTFLSKAFRRQDLAVKVREALDGRSECRARPRSGKYACNCSIFPEI